MGVSFVRVEFGLINLEAEPALLAILSTNLYSPSTILYSLELLAGGWSRVEEFRQVPLNGMPQNYDAERIIPSRIDVSAFPVHGGKFLLNVVNLVWLWP